MRNKTQAMEMDDPMRSMTSMARSCECESAFMGWRGAIVSFTGAVVAFRGAMVTFEAIVSFVQGKKAFSNVIVASQDASLSLHSRREFELSL
jgi:hypothetical protein